MRFIAPLFIFFVSLTALSEPVKYADRFSIKSNAFDTSRDIMVSLPASYDKNSDLLYPVIYTVRGQLDLLGVAAAVNMLDLEVPEFILIGINGTGEDFLHGEESVQTRFSSLVLDEVIPHIEKNYRVAPYSILVGHSAAGKFVVNNWLTGGSDFSSYYAISPELHDGKINQRIKSIAAKQLSAKQPLLVSMGIEDKRMQLMFDELKQLSSSNENIEFIQFQDQTHMSGRVHTVMAGLRRSFQDWRPSREVESGQLHELQKHYQGLTERFGYEIPIPLETMKRLSAFDSASKDAKRWENASKVVAYALNKRADDVDEFIAISDEMIAYGMTDGSKRLLSNICEHVPEHARCVEP